MNMSFLYKPRLLALLLFVMLALSFLWCVIDNILDSSQVVQTGDTGPVSTAVMVGGFLWLAGHGIHGAAVIALPAMLLRRTHPRSEAFNWEEELDAWMQK